MREGKTYDGIIGSDIINQYDWLIDIENKKAVMAYKISPPTLQNGETGYEMDLIFRYSSPYCQIRLNDSVPILFHFDTGYSSLIMKNNNESFYQDITFQFSSQNTIEQVKCYLQKKKILQIFELHSYIKGEKKGGFIINNLFTNGYNTNIIYASVDFGRFDNRRDLLKYGDELNGNIFLTANFLNRFKQVYYTPKKKKVCFIHSPSYKGYTGDEVESFIESLKQESLKQQTTNKTTQITGY